MLHSHKRFLGRVTMTQRRTVLSEDPLQEHLRVATLAAYTYTGNNPIAYDDPRGFTCRSATQGWRSVDPSRVPVGKDAAGY